MPELDHLIYAAPNVADGVAAIAALTGTEAVAGGRHVGVGTHNHLATFDQRTYFEIIGIDPDQPAPGRPRPFGLDDRSEPGLAGYAIHPGPDETLDDVVARMREVGIDPGEIGEMSRRKPDGDLLSWRLTVGGDTGAASDGALPFAIEWADGSSPALSLPSMGRLLTVEVTHPDATVRNQILELAAGVSVADGPAGLRALVEVESGAVWIT